MFHLKYEKKKLREKKNNEKEVIPGVGFEPTQTIRPLELKVAQNSFQHLNFRKFKVALNPM